jgi:pyruvate dehydrogenase E2 component (dihydrolipoamide acetyltransferase)
VALGDKVAEGSVVLLLEAADAMPAAPAAEAAAASAPAAAVPAPEPAAASPVPAAAPAGGGTVEVKVPDIGDFAEVAVIEVMVKPGDTVKVEQSLITVESDKASMEIPSSHAGVVKALKVKVALGDKVAEGLAVVLTLESAGAAATAAAPASPTLPAPPAAAAPRRLHRHRHQPLLPPLSPRRQASCRTPRPRCADLRVNSACR